MIITFDIEPQGELSPTMVAHNIGNSIGLPFEVVGTINPDEYVQLSIEVSPTDICGGKVAEPFNREDSK